MTDEENRRPVGEEQQDQVTTDEPQPEGHGYTQYRWTGHPHHQWAHLQGPPPPWPVPPPPPPRPRIPLPRAPVWLPIAVLGVGVVAALFATLDRPGAGLVLTGVVAGLTAFTALLVRPAIPEGGKQDETEGDGKQGEDTEPTGHAYAWSAIYGGLAVVLLFTALFRDAGWVLVWTLGASFLLASLAFAVRNPASRESTFGVAVESLALLRNLPSVPRFVTLPLQTTAARKTALPVLLTVGSTLLLLLIFGTLFAFADPVFGSFLNRMFASVEITGSLFGSFVAAVMATLCTGAAVLAARRRHPRRGPAAPATKQRQTSVPVWAWVVPLGALALLFTVFLGVQATALFGGEDYVQEVAGVTYAEYARQGFFQLVVVSLLVLGVITGAVRFLPSRPRAAHLLRNALLGALCVLTLIILASAMTRLHLYTDFFGLTRLRVTAEAWILWSAVVFGLILTAGVLNTLGRPARWLPRVTVALTAVSLALFAYSNPDLRIAESHHGLNLAEVDSVYLRGLSTDALPSLWELEGDDRDCAVERIQERVEDPDTFASWNTSRHRAHTHVQEQGSLVSVDEPESGRHPCGRPHRY